MTPAGGGVETGAIPTRVFFMAGAPGAGGWELLPPGYPFAVPGSPAGGIELVVPAGGGVDPCGDMPTSVFFIPAAEGFAVFNVPDDGRGGRSVAPHTPHVAVSGFAGDPQRGQALMPPRLLPVSAKRHGLVAKMLRD